MLFSLCSHGNPLSGIALALRPTYGYDSGLEMLLPRQIETWFSNSGWEIVGNAAANAAAANVCCLDDGRRRRSVFVVVEVTCPT